MGVILVRIHLNVTRNTINYIYIYMFLNSPLLVCIGKKIVEAMGNILLTCSVMVRTVNFLPPKMEQLIQ